jgi:predicted nucleic acid-binding Zn ribbon protein
MKKIEQMLPAAIGREEVLRAARAYRVLKDWAEIVGEAMATRSAPDRFDRGTVWVAVEGSAWAQELRMQKDQILRKLAERSGEPGLFDNIRFGVRPIVPAPPEPKVLKKRLREVDKGSDLTIREIAHRRLKNWPNGEPPQK